MDKVIKGLHCCAHTDGINCIYCPYDNVDEDCTALMSMDVLDLLKEQETRVLTLDEAAADQEVWTEAKLRGTEHIPLFISILWLTDDAKDFELELIGTSRRAFMLANEYGKTWRCWSSKPTDEQREAAKW